MERFKSEYRTFIFEGDTLNIGYGRLRYEVGMSYIPSENEESNTVWKINGIIEWCFIRNPIAEERFPNSRELGLRLTHKFSNEHELGFGYKLEEFLENSNGSENSGHIFMLEYRL